MPLVGLGNAAIPLPTGWTLNDVRCFVAGPRTVVIAPDVGGPLCAALRPGNAPYIVLDKLSAHPALRAVATEPFTLSTGEPAMIGTGSRRNAPWGGLKQTADRSLTVVVVPRLEVMAIGVAPAPGALDALLSRIQRVARNQVVIPPIFGRYANAVAQLGALGLQARKRAAGIQSAPNGYVISQHPAPGHVLARGSTVTLFVNRYPLMGAD